MFAKASIRQLGKNYLWAIITTVGASWVRKNLRHSSFSNSGDKKIKVGQKEPAEADSFLKKVFNLPCKKARAPAQRFNQGERILVDS